MSILWTVARVNTLHCKVPSLKYVSSFSIKLVALPLRWYFPSFLSTRHKFSTLMSSYVKALKALCPSLTHLAYAAGRVERAVPLTGSGKSPYGGEQHFVAAGNRTKSFVLLVSLIHIATMNAKNPALSRDICLVSPLKQITHAQSSSSMS